MKVMCETSAKGPLEGHRGRPPLNPDCLPLPSFLEFRDDGWLRELSRQEASAALRTRSSAVRLGRQRALRDSEGWETPSVTYSYR